MGHWDSYLGRWVEDEEEKPVRPGPLKFGVGGGLAPSPAVTPAPQVKVGPLGPAGVGGALTTSTPRLHAAAPQGPELKPLAVKPYSEVGPRGPTWDNFKERAEDNRMRMVQRAKSGIKGDVHEFMVLRDQMGKTKFDTRLEHVLLLYNSYMKPFQGDGVVWDMMRSSYSIPELEEMVKRAYPALMKGLPDPQMMRPLLELNGWDPDDRKQTDMAFLPAGMFGLVRRDRPGPVYEPPFVFADMLGKLGYVRTPLASGLKGEEEDGWPKEGTEALAAVWSWIAEGTKGIGEMVKRGWTKYDESVEEYLPEEVKGLMKLPFAMGGLMQPRQVAPEGEKPTFTEKDWKNYKGPQRHSDWKWDSPQAQQYMANLEQEVATTAAAGGVYMLSGMGGAPQAWKQTATGLANTSRVLAADSRFISSTAAGAGAKAITTARPLVTAAVGFKVLGEGIQTLDPMLYIEKQAQNAATKSLELEDMAEGRLESGVPGLPGVPDPLAQDSVYQQWMVVDAGLSRLAASAEETDVDTVIKMQLEMQARGYADGLEADGTWDFEWRHELLKMFSTQRRQNISLQQDLMASGFADKKLEINGDLTTPEWQESLGKAQTEWMRQQEFAQDHSQWSAFLDALGAPLTGEGWTAKWNKYWAEGFPQAFFKFPIQVAKWSGGAYNALIGSLDLQARMWNDDAYNQAWNDLQAYVADSRPPRGAFPEDAPFDNLPESPSKAYAQWAVTNGYLKNDSEAQALYATYMQNVSRLLDPALFGPNYISLVGNTFHMDEVGLMEFVGNNPDLVHATNVIVDLSIAVGAPKVTRGVRGQIRALRDVDRNMVAVEKSSLMNRTIDKLYDRLNTKGDMKWASILMGGTDAPGLLGEFFRKRGGDRAMWDTNALVDVSFKVAKAARSPNPIAGIREILPQISERAAKRIVRIIEKTPDELELGKIKADAMRGLDEQNYREVRSTELLEGDRVEIRRNLVETQKDIITIEREMAGQRKIGGQALTNAANKQVTAKMVDKVAKLYEAERMRTIDGELATAGLPNHWQARQIRSELIGRQTTHADVWGKVPLDKAEFKRAVQEAYVAGADIMPYLQDRYRVRPRNEFILSLDHAIGSVDSPMARRFLTAMVAWFHHAPMSQKDIFSPNAVERAFDGALAVSGDMRWAGQFATRFSLARTKSDFTRLSNDLAMHANERFRLGKANAVRGILSRLDPDSAPIEQASAALLPAQEMLRHTDPLGKPVGMETVAAGESTTAFYDPATKTMKQAVPDTSYAKYQMQLYRETLWAPYRIADDMFWMGRGLMHSRNLYRGLVKTAVQASTPLRQWAVALGGIQLAQKHALVDTGRSILSEGPESILFRRKYRHDVDNIMSELSPEGRDMLLTARHSSHMGEYLYNMGPRSPVYTAKRVYTKNGRAVNLVDGADALRRITMGRGYQHWSRGMSEVAEGVERGKNFEAGRSRVQAWLDTAEGKEFLKENNWYTQAEAFRKESPQAYEGMSTYDVAKYNYMQEIVQQTWETLEDVAPRTMATLRRVALNDEPLSTNLMKDLLKENYKSYKENPILSMPVTYGKLSSPAARLVGIAMKPNKWNRGAVFDKVFRDNYRDLVDVQKLDPNKAARIAATVAEMQTARVHFDLTNMLGIEAKHRWFAWFATKHRLYGMYLAEIALKRPMLAGAALEIKDWIEDKALEQGADKYDKTKITFSIGGKRISINVAPMFWLSDYPLESSMALVMEHMGANLVNVGANALGLSQGNVVERLPQFLRPTEPMFDLGITPVDAAVKTTWMVLDAHNKVGHGPEATEEKLSEYLASLDADDRRYWNRAMNKQFALAASKGEEITPLEAFNRAGLAGALTEYWNSFRLAPVRWEDEMWPEIEKQRQEFFNIKSDDERYDYLEAHPALQWSLNVYQDPVKEYAVNKGFQRIKEAQDVAIREMEQALDNGTIMVPGVVDKIINKYDQTWNSLLDSTKLDTYNEHFEEFVNATTDKNLLMAMGNIFPLVPAADALRAGAPLSTEDRKEIQLRYDDEFNVTLAREGLEPGDTSQPLYRILKMESDAKERKEMKLRSRDLTWEEETVAKFLARGGESGPYKRDYFLELVKQDNFRELIQKGLTMGRPVKNNPFMMALTPEQQASIGWNPAPRTGPINVGGTWKAWARAYKVLFDAQRGSGINPTSKEGKVQWENFEAWTQQLMKSDPEFAKEMQLSRMPLYQRLELFGVGTTVPQQDPRTRVEQQGWSEFISAMNDLHYDMDNFVLESGVKGVKTLQGKQSKVISDAYLKRLKTIRDQHPEWWDSFRRAFTLSDFGFYWHLADDSDKVLWWGPDYVPGELTTYEDLLAQGLVYGAE